MVAGRPNRVAKGELATMDNQNKSILELNYEVRQQKKDNSKKSYVRKVTAPERPVTFNEFNIPTSRKKKSTKDTLSKVLAVIDWVKHMRFNQHNDGLSVLYLSVKQEDFISICGSIASVSRLFDYMIQIGLLAEYDETYEFRNVKDKSKNHCKRYCYNHLTEVKVKEYCKEHNINIWKKPPTTKRIATKRIVPIGSFDNDKVRFSSNLQLLKPDNYSVSQMEEYLNNVLHHNYPELEYGEKLAQEINEKYYSEDYARRYKFSPNFTFNKGNKSVTKIGIRATNSLCNTKKEKEDGDEENILYREEVLNNYGLTSDFDVPSSIPRVIKLLNTGDWADSSVTYYEHITEEFNKICPEEKLDYNKKVIKDYFMPIAFDKESMISAHLKRRTAEVLGKKYNSSDWARLDKAMTSYRLATEKVLGNMDYGSEVFLAESIIYMEVTKVLLDRGINVLNIYDAWYTDIEVKDIDEIVKECAIKYYKMFIESKDNNNNSSSNSNSNSNNINNNKYKDKEYNIISSVFRFNNYKNNEHIELPDKDNIENLVNLAIGEIKILNNKEK